MAGCLVAVLMAFGVPDDVGNDGGVVVGCLDAVETDDVMVVMLFD